MSDLKGGAKYMATMSNIGGGSKKTGGNGVLGGMKTLKENNTAKTILKVAKKTQMKPIESKD